MQNTWRANFEKLHPLLKLTFDIVFILISFFMLSLTLVLISYSLGINVQDFSKFDEQYPHQYKLMNAIFTIFLFIIPAIVAAYIFSPQTFSYLSLNKNAKWDLWLTILLITIFFIPLTNILAEINKQIDLPSSLTQLQDKLKEMENTAEILTTKLLKVHSYQQFLLNILVIAILPAIGEEFLFRGILQRHTSELFRNSHIAILVVALFFGLVHFQFYTLLPRIVLGVLLGYIFYLSNNLWLAIFAHFINNLIVVVVYFVTARFSIDLDNTTNQIGTTLESYKYTALSAVIVSLLLIYFVFRTSKTKKFEN